MTVSVVIATRDYAAYLGDAIRSVLAQTVSDWELRIVDDGSTDDTPEVVRPFLSDTRIHYLRTDGVGQSRAKNVGWETARGEWVAYLDGDDAWLPTKLERQLRLARHDPNLSWLYTRRVRVDPFGAIRPMGEQPCHRGDVRDALLFDNFICFSSVMLRRKVFEHVGGFDPGRDLGIDYDLWLRVAPHYQCDFIDEALVRYRAGHRNLSQRTVERTISALNVLESLRQRDDYAPEQVRAAIARTYRTLGYLQRRESPFHPDGWRALAAATGHDGRWARSLREGLGTLKGYFFGSPTTRT